MASGSTWAIACSPAVACKDTPLHTLVPYKHVDHLHPNSVIALAACVNQQRLTAEVYGDDVLYDDGSGGCNIGAGGSVSFGLIFAAFVFTLIAVPLDNSARV